MIVEHSIIEYNLGFLGAESQHPRIILAKVNLSEP